MQRKPLAYKDRNFRAEVRREVEEQRFALHIEIMGAAKRLRLDLADNLVSSALRLIADSDDEFDFSTNMDGVQDAKYFLSMALNLSDAIERKHDDANTISALCTAFKLVGLVAATIGTDRTLVTCPTCIGKEYVSHLARIKANTVHDKPNGSRAKRQAIQDIWAGGKYTSRDICAEQECAALDMSFSTARKALRGQPDPT